MLRNLSIIIILLQAAMLQAAVIHVPADQATIQAGIAAAANGDTVLVSRGRYYENIFFRGKDITVASHYLLSGDQADIDSTVIDGSAPAKPDSASCVLFINGEDSTAVLCGFTLTRGGGTKWQDEHSAGTYREGGGVLVALCSPTIRNNMIIGNKVVGGAGLAGAGGGGIRAGDGDPRILNNVIALNSGADYGGGIVLNYCGAVVRNNLICGNSGGPAYGGGGMWLNDNGAAPRLIENNTITGNSSGSSGGGLCFLGSATATVVNTIIWANTTPQMSAGHAATYCDIEGGWAGAGNINSDPLFADLHYFLLTTASPCIDAGDSAASLNDPGDGAHPGQALWPARGALRSDIGAYGGPGCSALPRVPSTMAFVSPAKGATKIGLLAPLTVAFTSPADTSTLAFAFSDGAIALSPQWSARLDTLTLVHAQEFANLGSYQLTISALRDTAGYGLALLPDSATFRATDTVRPRIKSTTPANGATGIPLNAKLYIKFTKPVSRASFLYGFSDTSVHFTKAWFAGDTLVMLSHTKLFDSLGTYSLTVTAVQDTFGNSLAEGTVPNPFSFTSLITGVAGTPVPAPRSSRIGAVRPNPVTAGQRPSLEYELPAGCDVTMCLYNALGQEISSETWRGLTAGRHTVMAGDARLPQGVYFIRLQAGSTAAVRKFIVVR